MGLRGAIDGVSEALAQAIPLTTRSASSWSICRLAVISASIESHAKSEFVLSTERDFLGLPARRLPGVLRTPAHPVFFALRYAAQRRLTAWEIFLRASLLILRLAMMDSLSFTSCVRSQRTVIDDHGMRLCACSGKRYSSSLAAPIVRSR